jgi:hypothetical protein
MYSETAHPVSLLQPEMQRMKLRNHKSVTATLSRLLTKIRCVTGRTTRMQSKSLRNLGKRLCRYLCQRASPKAKARLQHSRIQDRYYPLTIWRMRVQPRDAASVTSRQAPIISAGSKKLARVPPYAECYERCYHGRLWLDLDKSTKSTGRDPRRPRRLRRCANQDRSRGRNYTSNRGFHATFNGCFLLDTSGTRPSMDTVRDVYSRCGHAYLTVACVLPLAGFLRWRLQSQEGPLHQGSATQDARSIKFFQVRPLPCPKHDGAMATIFVAAQTTGTSPKRTKDCCCHYPFKTSFKQDRSVCAGLGLADPARTSTEGAAPTTPPKGVIGRMRQGSIVGSVGPLHGPCRKRSHASAGQPDRPEGEDQLGPTTSHLGQCCRRTFRRTRRTNQMCSTYSLRLRRRQHRLPGIHHCRHSDRGRDPSGEQACEWTSGLEGETRS